MDTADNNETAAQMAIISTDLKGMTIFLNPYVNPTLKLSRLRAKANKKSEMS